MRDERIVKLADMLVNYSAAVKPGQKVWVRGSTLAEPLLKAVYVKVLEAGAMPYMTPSFPDLDELFYQHASDEQISYLPEPLKYMIENADAMIQVMGEVNTRGLSQVPPAKMALRSKAYQPYFETFLQRAARQDLRWTLTLFPTQAYAMDAEMSLSDYEDFVYGACMPDANDPVGYWKQFSARQDKIVDWMKGKRNVHVIAPGTDLRLSVEGRTFINCDCHENVPDGEIFTGPVENSVEGHVYFSYPTVFAGREVDGVRLWFEHGKVVKATADKNEEYLLQTLDTDEGARYLGEFAFGTNEGIQRFTREILFDEKIGGSFHMALGAGYPETGSHNESAIHWDMVCDLRNGGEVRVDDALMYQNGRFVMDLD